MQILKNFDFQLNNTAVCIGKFDGIHRGHRLLAEDAKASGYTVVMIAFEFPHDVIYSIREKEKLAEKLGIDILVEIPVDEAFMRMPADVFTQNILVEKCGAKLVSIGEDFCFGYQRSGNIEFLTEAGKQYGFDVHVFGKLREKEEVISSTVIRKELKEGNLEKVNCFLGTPYFIAGVVKNGNRIGRTIAVPTANIFPDGKKVLPPFGVYATLVQVGENWYKGVSNLGVKPTIEGDNPVGLETWLLDFEDDIYEQEIVVHFIGFIRPEQKFDSVQMLKEQIGKDTKKAMEMLAETSLEGV